MSSVMSSVKELQEYKVGEEYLYHNRKNKKLSQHLVKVLEVNKSNIVVGLYDYKLTPRGEEQLKLALKSADKCLCQIIWDKNNILEQKKINKPKSSLYDRKQVMMDDREIICGSIWM